MHLERFKKEDERNKHAPQRQENKKEKKNKKKQHKQIGITTAENSEKTRAWNARVHSSIYINIYIYIRVYIYIYIHIIY